MSDDVWVMVLYTGGAVMSSSDDDFLMGLIIGSYGDDTDYASTSSFNRRMKELQKARLAAERKEREKQREEKRKTLEELEISRIERTCGQHPEELALMKKYYALRKEAEAFCNVYRTNFQMVGVEKELKEYARRFRELPDDYDFKSISKSPPSDSFDRVLLLTREYYAPAGWARVFEKASEIYTVQSKKSRRKYALRTLIGIGLIIGPSLSNFYENSTAFNLSVLGICLYFFYLCGVALSNGMSCSSIWLPK
jgi:hypothetical protein